MKIGVTFANLLFIANLFAAITDYELHNPRLAFSPTIASYDQIANNQLSIKWQNEFLNQYGEQWTILIDLRGATPAHVFGQGIPFIFGSGNDLKFNKTSTEDEVVNLVKDFFSRHSTLFGMDTSELKLSQAIKVDSNWYVNFVRAYKGVPVSGSSLIVTISNGNLIRFSTTKWGEIDLDVEPSLTALQSLNTLYSYIGGLLSSDIILNAGSLFIIPVTVNDEDIFHYSGTVGSGYKHTLAWKVTMRREGEGEWSAAIDAHTGELLALYPIHSNALEKGTVSGSIYYHSNPNQDPVHSADTSVLFNLPFTDVREPASSCYGTGDDRCNSKEHCPIEEQILGSLSVMTCDGFESPDTLYCSNDSGVFSFDRSIYAALQTRLYGPYINIAQSFHVSFEYNECGCDDDTTNPVFMCAQDDISSDNTLSIDLGGVGAVSTCKENINTSILGNNNAARTSFYHGNYLKEVWRSKYHWRQRPFSQPYNCVQKYSSPALRKFLTNSTKVEVNAPQLRACSNSRGGGCYAAGKLDENGVLVEEHYLSLSKDFHDQIYNLNWNNAGENPGTIYHEFGHGIDDHDGIKVYCRPDASKITFFTR